MLHSLMPQPYITQNDFPWQVPKGKHGGRLLVLLMDLNYSCRLHCLTNKCNPAWLPPHARIAGSHGFWAFLQPEGCS